MAADTITGLQALFKVAEDAQEIRAANVTAVDGTKRILTTSLTATTNDTYNYGLCRIGAKGIQIVSDYDGTNKTVTVPAAFSPDVAAGDLLELAWWNATKRARAFNAVNEAIRMSWPAWYRDVLIEVNDTGVITLADGTNEYALPSDCLDLYWVGFQDAAGERIDPIYPMDLWRVHGEPGAMVVRFIDNGRWYIPRDYDGELLCFAYAAREPELTALSGTGGTTRLPLAYFAVAAEIYRQRELNDADAADLTSLNVNLPRLDGLGRAALRQAGMLKQKPPFAGLRYE